MWWGCLRIPRLFAHATIPVPYRNTADNHFLKASLCSGRIVPPCGQPARMQSYGDMRLISRHSSLLQHQRSSGRLLFNRPRQRGHALTARLRCMRNGILELVGCFYIAVGYLGTDIPSIENNTFSALGRKSSSNGRSPWSLMILSKCGSSPHGMGCSMRSSSPSSANPSQLRFL